MGQGLSVHTSWFESLTMWFESLTMWFESLTMWFESLTMRTFLHRLTKQALPSRLILRHSKDEGGTRIHSP